MEQQYIDALNRIVSEGCDTQDRTGVGSRSVFGIHMRHDLSQGFPVLTTKKIAWRAVVGELLWFLEGSSDLNRLSELTHGAVGHRTIWDDNVQVPDWQRRSLSTTDAGRIYGVQWRQWRGADDETVDQLANLISGIRADPHGRRHILTAWQPAEFHQMCLPPCHILSQFYVRQGRLSCQLYQRSGDMFLGVPFNMASYSLLTHMIAQVCDLEVGEFIHVIGDAHIYHNHFEQVAQQTVRPPYALPQLKLNTDRSELDQFQPSDCELTGYVHHPAIKAPMAV